MKILLKSSIHSSFCLLLTNKRNSLYNTLRNLGNKLFEYNNFLLSNILAFGKEYLNTNQNAVILNVNIEIY